MELALEDFITSLKEQYPNDVKIFIEFFIEVQKYYKTLDEVRLNKSKIQDYINGHLPKIQNEEERLYFIILTYFMVGVFNEFHHYYSQQKIQEFMKEYFQDFKEVNISSEDDIYNDDSPTKYYYTTLTYSYNNYQLEIRCCAIHHDYYETEYSYHIKFQNKDLINFFAGAKSNIKTFLKFCELPIEEIKERFDKYKIYKTEKEIYMFYDKNNFKCHDIVLTGFYDGGIGWMEHKPKDSVALTTQEYLDQIFNKYNKKEQYAIWKRY